MQGSGSPYRSFRPRPVTSYAPQGTDRGNSYKSRLLPGFGISGSALQPQLIATYSTRRPITARVSSLNSSVHGSKESLTNFRRPITAFNRRKTLTGRPFGGVRPTQSLEHQPGRFDNQSEWITITKCKREKNPSTSEHNEETNVGIKSTETAESKTKTDTNSSASSFLPQVPIVVVKRTGIVSSKPTFEVTGNEAHDEEVEDDKDSCSSVQEVRASSDDSDDGSDGENDNLQRYCTEESVLKVELPHCARDTEPIQWSTDLTAPSPTKTSPKEDMVESNKVEDNLSSSPRLTPGCNSNIVPDRDVATPSDNSCLNKWPLGVTADNSDIFLTSVPKDYQLPESYPKTKINSAKTHLSVARPRINLQQSNDELFISSKEVKDPKPKDRGLSTSTSVESKHVHKMSTALLLNEQIAQDQTVGAGNGLASASWHNEPRPGIDKRPGEGQILPKLRSRPNTARHASSFSPGKSTKPNASAFTGSQRHTRETTVDLRQRPSRPRTSTSRVPSTTPFNSDEEVDNQVRSKTMTGEEDNSITPEGVPDKPYRDRPTTARVSSARPVARPSISIQKPEENKSTYHSKSTEDIESAPREEGGDVYPLHCSSRTIKKTDSIVLKENRSDKKGMDTLEENPFSPDLGVSFECTLDKNNMNSEHATSLTSTKNELEIHSESEEDLIPDDTNSEASDLEVRNVLKPRASSENSAQRARPSTARASASPTDRIRNTERPITSRSRNGGKNPEESDSSDSDALEGLGPESSDITVLKKRSKPQFRPKTGVISKRSVEINVPDNVPKTPSTPVSLGKTKRPMTSVTHPSRSSGLPKVSSSEGGNVEETRRDSVDIKGSKSRWTTGRSPKGVSSPRRPRTSVIQRNSAKIKSTNSDLPPGFMTVVLSVANILLPMEEHSGSRVKEFQNKILKFYTAILREESKYAKKIAQLSEFHNISVQAITLGSLRLHVLVRSLEALERLKKLYISNDLSQLMTDVLLSKQVLEEVGVEKMELAADIDQREFSRCKLELTTVVKKPKGPIGTRPRRSSDSTIFGKRRGSGQTSALSLESSEKEFMPRLQCLAHLSDGYKEFEECVLALHRRYTNISSNIHDFMMTMKLVKPVQMKEFKYLGDVIAVHNYLESSPSVGKSLPTQLVSDFLAIVNLSHQNLKDITAKVRTLEYHILNYISKEGVVDFYRKVLDFRDLLDPSFMFSSLETKCPFEVSVMDKKLFSDLLCYLPILLNNLDELVAKIEVIHRDLLLVPQEDDHQLQQENAALKGQ